MENLVPIIFGLFFLVAFIVIYGGSAAWVVNDAQKRGHAGTGPFVLLWICGPAGALLWFLIRPRTVLAERPPEEYSSADDALTAAAKLDMLGEWDEAINLYCYAAGQWPEHKSYVNECIKAINAKKEAGVTS
jgi:hypothetical protein